MHLIIDYIHLFYYSFFLPLEQNSCEYGSVKYYIYCGISGMISCGATHTAVVPLVCYLF
jgi:hypothetical protein